MRNAPLSGAVDLSVAGFNVNDPYVNVMVSQVNGGAFLLGTFALNRLTGSVGFDHLKATDIDKIDPQMFVGPGPITRHVPMPRFPTDRTDRDSLK